MLKDPVPNSCNTTLFPSLKRRIPLVFPCALPIPWKQSPVPSSFMGTLPVNRKTRLNFFC